MSPPLPLSAAERQARLQQRRARHFVFGRYAIGVMLGLVGSLPFVLIAARLPIWGPPAAVYWRPTLSRERIALEMLELTRRSAGEEGAPVTRFEIPQTPAAVIPAGADAGPEEEAPPGPAPDVRRIDMPARLTGHRVLDFAETMPAIEGGLRSYYLHIDYPPEAAEAGIQGRLVLEFIVEVDGSTSDVQVLRSLHPLCDSAAVRALRLTRFVPGKQNGVVTRVRMRLPVRFQLVNRTAEPTVHPQGVPSVAGDGES